VARSASHTFRCYRFAIRACFDLGLRLLAHITYINALTQSALEKEHICRGERSALARTRGAPETEKGSRAASGWKKLSAVTQIMTRQIRSRAARSPLLNNHTIIKWLVMYPDRNIIFQLALRRGADCERCCSHFSALS
jgi:hypothetical protein